jgi:hypothetical protein
MLFTVVLRTFFHTAIPPVRLPCVMENAGIEPRTLESTQGYGIADVGLAVRYANHYRLYIVDTRLHLMHILHVLIMGYILFALMKATYHKPLSYISSTIANTVHLIHMLGATYFSTTSRKFLKIKEQETRGSRNAEINL